MSPATSIATKSLLFTQEKSALAKNKSQDLFIGIPKEVSYQENRVALTPDAVSILTKNGHKIKIESGAGQAANFTDNQYSEAGAEIVHSSQEVFKADIILKIEPLVAEELDLLQMGQTLISTLNLPSLEKEYFDILLKKRITCIGFEFLEDKAGDLPIVRAMSEIAGSSSVLIASEYLSTERSGRGMLLGGITGVPPTSVVIIGAGTVAEYAARTALGLGAEVKVFDTHLYRLQRLKYAVGHGIYTSIIDSVSLSKALCEADVVIGSMRAEKGLSPMVVDDTMVQKMKEGSVIIDVAIDHGGCIETSRMTSLDKPVFVRHGVIHYCVPNIASRVAHTASTALSNIFTPTIIKIGNLGGVEEMILSNQWFMKGVYAYKGNVTNMYISKKYNLRYRELGLLLAARF
ncbi:alanine dehydrogenase [Spirosomataceae bacterium TFI 002]|nr:alanine dehydrogenase [Spirosomataceae bacterium TFI 002]